MFKNSNLLDFQYHALTNTSNLEETFYSKINYFKITLKSQLKRLGIDTIYKEDRIVFRLNDITSKQDICDIVTKILEEDFSLKVDNIFKIKESTFNVNELSYLYKNRLKYKDRWV